MNTIEKFGKLYLPLSGYQQRGQIHRGHVEVDKEMKDGKILDNISILFEIDLGQLNLIKKALGLSKLDCYPLTWCYQELRTQSYVHSFNQRVACKFLAVKLIERHPF